MIKVTHEKKGTSSQVSHLFYKQETYQKRSERDMLKSIVPLVKKRISDGSIKSPLMSFTESDFTRAGITQKTSKGF